MRYQCEDVVKKCVAKMHAETYNDVYEAVIRKIEES